MSVHQNIPRGAGELRPKPLMPVRLKPGIKPVCLFPSHGVKPSQGTCLTKDMGSGMALQLSEGSVAGGPWLILQEHFVMLCTARLTKGAILTPKRLGGAEEKPTLSWGFMSPILQGTAPTER